ncbi:MAG: NAD(P)/FAD-dependent oxidoreductase [Deltaproteobacteria bacterium]|nr:MAG: NAD(P)/FAD-dependent oxidoreductase [Deltaproteobacteria bacterium]
MADYDAIVIGSGAGGMSASLKLARCGFSVLLLEAMPAFGGYLNPFRRRNYTFNPGLHYLGELAREDSFWRLLDELGIGEAVRFVELDPEGFDRYLFPDYELRVCKGREHFIERLISDFPKEERGIEKFFEAFDKIIEAVKASRSMEGEVLKMLSFMLKHPIMLRYSRVPYQRLLDEVTSDRRLQAALAAPCGSYGVPPARASVITAIMVWAHYLKGAYYPHGGGGALRDAFVKGLRKHGAELKNRSRVVSINKQGGEFVVEIESDHRYTARAVISDADPVITLGRLVNPKLVAPRIKTKASRMRPSAGALCAFIGTDLDLPSIGITDANIIHYSDYDINKVYELFPVSRPPEDFPSFFITSPSVKDPDGGHAPEGYHTIEIITGASYELFKKWANLPSGKRGDEYKALKEKMGERLIAAAERYIPGLSQHLDLVEYATPLSNAYWVNAVRGGCYGPEHSPDQIGRGRFTSFTAGIDGLFLAGAGTIGCGVMPCVASGILAGGKAASYLEP